MSSVSYFMYLLLSVTFIKFSIRLNNPLPYSCGIVPIFCFLRCTRGCVSYQCYYIVLCYAEWRVNCDYMSEKNKKEKNPFLCVPLLFPRKRTVNLVKCSQCLYRSNIFVSCLVKTLMSCTLDWPLSPTPWLVGSAVFVPADLSEDCHWLV